MTNPFDQPRNNLEHAVCPKPEDCMLCMLRCYEGSHIFLADASHCNCGEQEAPEQ